MGDSETQRLREELAAANREIERLRSLLGLSDESSEAGRSWEPSLFTVGDPLPAVDESSPNELKLTLFHALFAGRRDVYATRWENASTGKSGWSPAVRGGWPRAKSGARRDYLPLTDEVLASHLRGDAAVGVYPLLQGDRTRLLACDFDGAGWALDALAYVDASRELDLPVALERSRSGNGAHVWTFFAEDVAASTARSLGAGLLRRAMERRVEIDLASYDRLFPSQDFIPKGSFGNLIALPLDGRARRGGTTVFLDPAALEPWPDQWAFLGSLHRLSADALAEVVKAIGDVDLGPASVGWKRFASKTGPPAPAVVRAQLGGQLSIERAGLPPAIVAELKHLSSLHNPVFYEKQKMRFSTWNTPRIIRCYEENLDRLHLPRGLVDQVSTLFAEAGSHLAITDVRDDPEPIELAFGGTLTPVQQRAVDALTPHDLGVLVAPPGTGKTVMACALIAHHRVPTLVLCDRQELISQWRQRISEHLGLDDKSVGQIAAGRNRRSGLIDIATIQTVARREDPTDLFAGYGLVVVDECHHLPAVSFETCVRRAGVRRWLGLTATPYRRDGLEAILNLQCGPLRHEIAVASTDAALLRLELVVHETICDPECGPDAPIQSVLQAIAEDDERNALVCSDVAAAIYDGRNCLVLTQRTDHIDRLVERLQPHGIEPLVLKGGLGKKTRSTVHERLHSGDGPVVLIATGSYLGEGFDWPALDTLFLAFPIAWKGRVVQYVGRLLRGHDGKHDVEVHDYVDSQVPVLAKMHVKRLTGYAALGFDVRAARRSASRSKSKQD